MRFIPAETCGQTTRLNIYELHYEHTV